MQVPAGLHRKDGNIEKRIFLMNESLRKYNLSEIYGQETSLQRYKRLTVGENASTLSLIWHELLLGICMSLPGLPGYGLRHKLYPKFFRQIHSETFIGRYVTLRCPLHIATEKGVIIDDFAQLVATTRHPQGIKLGENSFVRSYAMINSGPPDGFVHIGKNSGIGQGTILYGNGGLTIGDNVLIAGQCFIVASSHVYTDPDKPVSEQGYTAKGINIENNVWIGAGAKLLDGISVGEGAIIGANSVVTKSVNPHTTIAGIPARPLAK